VATRTASFIVLDRRDRLAQANVEADRERGRQSPVSPGEQVIVEAVVFVVVEDRQRGPGGRAAVVDLDDHLLEHETKQALGSARPGRDR
jgi:hypothetical protein